MLLLPRAILTPLPEGEGGAQSEANGRVRGYGLTDSNSNSLP